MTALLRVIICDLDVSWSYPLINLSQLVHGYFTRHITYNWWISVSLFSQKYQKIISANVKEKVKNITYYRRRPLIVCNKVSASALDSSPQSKDYGQQLRRLSRSPGDRRLSGVIGGRWLEDAILLLCVVRQASAPSNHLSAWTSLLGSGCLGT